MTIEENSKNFENAKRIGDMNIFKNRVVQRMELLRANNNLFTCYINPSIGVGIEFEAIEFFDGYLYTFILIDEASDCSNKPCTTIALPQ